MAVNAQKKPASTDAEVVALPAAEAKPTGEQASAAAPADGAATEPAKPKRSRRLLLMVSVPLVLAIGGGWFWLSGGRYVETDNAYVQQHMVAVSPDVAGRIVSVAVHENQVVAAGDTLFSIDPVPYRIAFDQANAALAAARVNVEQLKVAYGTARAQLEAAQQTLDIRQAEYDRKQSLATKGLAADSTLDDVRLALQQAQTNVALARQQVAGAAAALAGAPEAATDAHPAVRAALAQVETAERNLASTTVVAPAAGVVSQVGNLNVGQFVATGSTIATIVATGEAWIEANFKETQLATLAAGQPAEVSIDALAGVKCEGDVESIGAATGSQFALIPAQNATGNWVKVTQRLPVRIHVVCPDAARLRAGMSANVSVDTGRSTLDQLLGK